MSETQAQEAKQTLLKDRRVVEEINRHLWIESEKAGRDIGFDNAAADWLERFSTAWMQYHMPAKKAPTVSDAQAKTKGPKAATSSRVTSKRSAKSYTRKS